MQKKEVTRAYLVLIVIIIFIIAFILSRMPVFEGITGAISARGGYITGMNISAESNSQHWASRFGEVNVNSGSNYTYSTTVTRGSTAELNLTLGCVGEELYAGTSTISDWPLITAGTTGLVDDYLQLSASASESAASMFTESEVYLVKDNSLSIPVTHTLARGSNPNVFELGILNYSNTIIMVTLVVQNQIGFDVRTHDYQLLLPTINEQTTYYFFSDCVLTTETPSPGAGGGGGSRTVSPALPVKEEKKEGERKDGEGKGEKKAEEEKLEELPADIITKATDIILEKYESKPLQATIKVSPQVQIGLVIVESSTQKEGEHHLMIKEVGENYAVITLPHHLFPEITLKLGESTTIDFDEDSLPDLKITLQATNIKLNYAHLTLQSLGKAEAQETSTEAVKTTSFQPPLAGKAWGMEVTEKFALYFFPLTLMTMVMLILVLLLFWVKKRQRKRNGKDFKLQHNSHTSTGKR